MTDKTKEALKLALGALVKVCVMLDNKYNVLPNGEAHEDVSEAITAIREALAEQPAQQEQHQDWCASLTKMLMSMPPKPAPCNCKQPAQPQKEGFASPGGGYVPAIPRPMPLDWKLVPRKATPEMLKAMDECAQEGYDERLYAGMASSVYMAAWDASPVMGTLPEQPAQQQEPVAFYVYKPTLPRGNLGLVADGDLPWVYDQDPSSGFSARMLVTPVTSPPAQRKPWAELTDEDIQEVRENCGITHHATKTIEAKLKEKNT